MTAPQSKGGEARAKSLTADDRRRIATLGAKARWDGKRRAPDDVAAVTLRVPKHLRAKLKALAKLSGTNLSAYVVAQLQAALNEPAPPGDYLVEARVDVDQKRGTLDECKAWANAVKGREVYTLDCGGEMHRVGVITLTTIKRVT